LEKINGREFGKRSHTMKDNIQKDLKGTGCGFVDWIHVV
jgi:hypothetical protein